MDAAASRFVATDIGKDVAVQPLAADSRPPAKTRIGFLDNLRILLTALVILQHTAIAYGSPVGSWYYSEPGEVGLTPAILMVMFIAVNTAFFMGFFFLLAGYFTPGAYDRKGAGTFLADRLKRLGIPLLFYALVIHPLLEYAGEVGRGYQGSLGQFVQWRHERAFLGAFGVGVMWFVEELLVLALAYALWRRLTRSTRPMPQSDSRAPSNRAIALAALILGLATFFWRTWAPEDRWLEPLHIQPAHLPQYVVLFVLGIVAYRQNWLVGITDAQGRIWRWLVVPLIALLPVLMVAGGAMEGEVAQFQGGLRWQSLAYALWQQLTAAAIIVTLLVWFRRRFNHQGSLARAMAQGSYATYIFHPVVVVAVTFALVGVRLDLALKFVLIAPVAVSLCFLVAHYVRKLPLARSVL